MKQQHSTDDFFRSNPNFRANFYPAYDDALRDNPAFHLLRRDDRDASIDVVLGADRFGDRYDRFGRDGDWNDE
jgi:hypothetical protein